MTQSHMQNIAKPQAFNSNLLSMTVSTSQYSEIRRSTQPNPIPKGLKYDENYVVNSII